MDAFTVVLKSGKPEKSKSKALEIKDDEYNYPFDVQELTNAYITNPYNAECLRVKAINIVGKGFDPKIMDILEDVTPSDSSITILLKTVRDYLIYGNAYWEIPKVGSKRQVFHLPAQTMKKTKNGYRQTVGDESVDFAEEEIYHFKQISPLSTIYGAPSYLPILSDIRIIKRIKTYNERFFDNNAIPDYVLEVMGGTITENAIYTMQRFFRDKYQGEENAHKLLVIPYKEGMTSKWTPLQTRDDGSFLNLEKQSITNIIASHGVPPRLLSIIDAGQLGGGGETEGQLDIFFITRVLPEQEVIKGLFGGLAKRFPTIFGTDPDFTIIPLTYPDKNNLGIDDLLRRS